MHGVRTLSVTQTTFTDTLSERSEVKGYSEIPDSPPVELGPTTGKDTVVNRPYLSDGEGDATGDSH